MSFLLVCVQTYEKLSAEQNKSCLFFCRDEVSNENLHKKLDMEYLLSEKSVQRNFEHFFADGLSKTSSLSYDKFLSTTDVDAMCWIRYSSSLQVIDGIIHSWVVIRHS